MFGLDSFIPNFIDSKKRRTSNFSESFTRSDPRPIEFHFRITGTDKKAGIEKKGSRASAWLKPGVHKARMSRAFCRGKKKNLLRLHRVITKPAWHLYSFAVVFPLFYSPITRVFFTPFFFLSLFFLGKFNSFFGEGRGVNLIKIRRVGMKIFFRRDTCWPEFILFFSRRNEMGFEFAKFFFRQIESYSVIVEFLFIHTLENSYTDSIIEI